MEFIGRLLEVDFNGHKRKEDIQKMKTKSKTNNLALSNDTYYSPHSMVDRAFQEEKEGYDTKGFMENNCDELGDFMCLSKEQIQETKKFFETRTQK